MPEWEQYFYAQYSRLTLNWWTVGAFKELPMENVGYKSLSLFSQAQFLFWFGIYLLNTTPYFIVYKKKMGNIWNTKIYFLKDW